MVGRPSRKSERTLKNAGALTAWSYGARSPRHLGVTDQASHWMKHKRYAYTSDPRLTYHTRNPRAYEGIYDGLVQRNRDLMDELQKLQDRNYELRNSMGKLTRMNDYLTESFSHLFNKMENKL